METKPAVIPPQLESSWAKVLQEEFQKPYMENLKTFISKERNGPSAIYPPSKDVFNAFFYTPIDQVKVVIVGQDPYHGPGQAHGLCFSVPEGVAPPPSLQNIFKELKSDLGIPIPKHGCLIAWAKQGVLLLNATLTVSQASPMSHHKKGWEQFTDAVIQILAERSNSLVFILWGRSAQEKCKYLVFNSSHLILKAAHPSPFSAHSGFFGCRHFSKTNQFLIEQGKTPIDWDLARQNL